MFKWCEIGLQFLFICLFFNNYKFIFHLLPVTDGGWNNKKKSTSNTNTEKKNEQKKMMHGE